ncbi:G/U mismatch-specific uracil-DNA glycosylase [Nakamurella panacisegetis]|uniref:G/U mismatch-specific uracil-DNA glycosylase n=1 Tax=Nakamurella panacisegetis TaxID=1090615 RepID=A0A1H0HSG9_9ACTN|nr:mismatch-specific DNA-glycosylase [Nakamurella panacisegetis]SDO22054.1 G/U mismatch-specific uracil-DNA glycosylase [Nakamurella panacisegetis]
MGRSRSELQAFSGRTVPDLLGPDVRLLFVGINPGLWTAAVGAHFARRGNRFYPALRRGGIIDRDIDASAGYRPEDLAHLLERGIGITNLVPAASARADELTREQLRAGGVSLAEVVARVRPKVVAVLGITAYRTAFGRPGARPGRQSEEIAGVPVWVLPNPSGLNAHETVDSLAAAYREVAVAAGLATG